MKILQVIPVFNPPELFGGSQQVVYQISRELVKRGHNVSVFTSDAKRSNLKDRVSIKNEIIDGVSIVHHKNTSSILTKELGFIITAEMRKSLEREGRNFDLIHVHEARSYQHIIVWQFSRKNKVPYVVQAHGILGEGRSLSRDIYDFVYGKKVLKDAAMNIALNENEAEQYSAIGISRDRIRIIPNGIDLLEYADLPPKGSFKKKFDLGDDVKIVLYLGRIHRIKGLDILVKAFASIIKKMEGVRLVVAGPDDGYLNELEGLIKALRIENKVLILSPLYGRNKLEAYVDADVYVLPSRYEAFPITVIEAYACGKPVVASSCSGLQELVENGETGILVEPGNIYELSKAIKLILSGNMEDTATRNKEVAKRFSITKTVDKIEEVYYSTIGNK